MLQSPHVDAEFQPSLPCAAPRAGSGRRLPAAVYDTVETLLPNSKGRFMELWARAGLPRRAGWEQVALAPPGL